MFLILEEKLYFFFDFKNFGKKSEYFYNFLKI